MNDAVTVGQFIDRCKDIKRVSHLWQAALEFFHGHGIAMVSYHSNDAQRRGAEQLAIVEDGFPRDWVCHYMEAKLYRIDPIPALTKRLSEPFLWSDAPRLSELSQAERGYMSELAEADLGDGLALQVYGPNMRNAYVGLGFGTEAPKLSPDYLFELKCAAQIAHIRYCELTADRQGDGFRLSRRELEVLRWIARGKSNGVIAEIMGVSRHTVDTMTRRMFEKMDVNDRTTAAIRGLGAGLLFFPDAVPI